MKAPGYLPDINFWLGLAFEKHPFRPVALEWWKNQRAREGVFFNRVTQQGFLRLSSNPAFLKQYGVEANTNKDALAALNGFMARPGVGFRNEPGGIEEIWHRLAGVERAAPNVWMDAYLAAFAIRTGLSLVTFDSGFAKYEEEGLSLHFLDLAEKKDEA